MSVCMSQRTVGNCADEDPGEIDLLQEVHPGRDLGSIGIIGPEFFCGS